MRKLIPFIFLIFVFTVNISYADESLDNHISIGVVNTNYLNLRSSTNKTIAPISKLNKGESLKIFGKIDDWYIVQTESNQVGIVSSEFVKILETEGNNKEALSDDEEKILSLINNERTKNNLAPLIIDKDLQNIARLKANDLVENNYFSHTSPVYGSPFEMLKNNSIKYKIASENIAGNSDIEKAVESWLKSPSHQKNILNNDYNFTGIGVANSLTYGKIIVEFFIGR